MVACPSASPVLAVLELPSHLPQPRSPTVAGSRGRTSNRTGGKAGYRVATLARVRSAFDMVVRISSPPSSPWRCRR
jgi:hypothetical protein